MDEFTLAYVVCALWSSLNYYGVDETDHAQSFQQDGFGPDDLSDELRSEMIADCKQFQEMNEKFLTEAYSTGYTPSQAGHDFWLTREGHGAGFWDRGLGDIGDVLADHARQEGSFDLYLHEGKVCH